MDSELNHNINMNRPQKPQGTQKQIKDQEHEVLSNTNKDQSPLTMEQQGLLQEFRQKINSETVKESLKQSNIQKEDNITQSNNNGITNNNFGQNNEYGMVMASLPEFH